MVSSNAEKKKHARGIERIVHPDHLETELRACLGDAYDPRILERVIEISVMYTGPYLLPVCEILVLAVERDKVIFMDVLSTLEERARTQGGGMKLFFEELGMRVLGFDPRYDKRGEMR